MQFGLLGRKLGHSYSPQIHDLFADYTYKLYETEPEALEYFLKHSDLDGFNVTIPYKKNVVPYCSELSAQAEKLGAVNTILRRADGSLYGHNTDYFGFMSMVNESGLDLTGKKVLVLGSGGASATVVAVLKELGAEIIIVSRSGSDNYSNLSRHADASVIVNTTPVGMYPHVGISPVSLDIFPKLEGVLDLIYNPASTELLQQAEKRGIVAMNGLWMLVAQAKESAELFTGKSIEDGMIAYVHNKLRNQMQNIVLIGMPGCGKSTIGKLLADKTGKIFIDVDSEVEMAAGCSIPEIFANSGEQYFRKLETEALSDVCKRSGCIIATGGGCVTKKENYPLLHQNSQIVWLKRDISLLPTNGRPLSTKSTLASMYSIREPLYAAFSDLSIDNSISAIDTVCKILTALNWEA